MSPHEAFQMFEYIYSLTIQFHDLMISLEAFEQVNDLNVW